MEDRARARAGRLAELAVAAALVAFALLAARLALVGIFALDEPRHAHAAWLVAQGEVPYRDFFAVEFPLVYQALAPLFLIAGDDPTAIVWLRAGMLGFLALSCAGVALLNRDDGRVASLAAPLFLLALPPFVALATQIRPAPAAFGLFAASLGVLRARRLGDRTAAFAGGLLLAGALWASQTAALYASVVALALVLDLVARRDAGRPLLRSTSAYLGGLACGTASIAIWLTFTGSWAAWWASCFSWAAAQRQPAPGFSWRRDLAPILGLAPWLVGLAALGAGLALRRMIAAGRAATRAPDLVLLAALGTTLASLALQRTPDASGALPFLGVAATFAARGAAFLLGPAVPRVARAVAAAALIGVLLLQARTLERFVAVDNAAQLAVLERIGTLTGPTDHAYDNSGGYVSRPHAYRYFHTDPLLRESLADALVAEVPRAILDTGTVLHLRDPRFDSLPSALRGFLERNFQPYDGDIALWGRRYEVPASGSLLDRFFAVQPDLYFVSPPEALERGRLTMDARRVTTPTFTLERGEHVIGYDGPPGELAILWLPRDGEPWQPRRGLPPTLWQPSRGTEPGLAPREAVR